MKTWAARLVVALLLPFGLLVLAYWLIEDWIKGRKIGGFDEVERAHSQAEVAARICLRICTARRWVISTAPALIARERFARQMS